MCDLHKGYIYGRPRPTVSGHQFTNHFVAMNQSFGLRIPCNVFFKQLTAMLLVRLCRNTALSVFLLFAYDKTVFFHGMANIFGMLIHMCLGTEHARSKTFIRVIKKGSWYSFVQMSHIISKWFGPCQVKESS